MKKQTALAAILALTSTAALAADLGTRTYVKAPVAAPVADPAYNWSGFYTGLEAGTRMSNSTWTTTRLGDPLPPIGTDVTDLLSHDNPVGFNNSTFRGAFYTGYNWQFAPTWVVGLEGDVGYANHSKTHAGIIGTEGALFEGFPTTHDSSTVRERWDASIRARLGFLVMPNLMIFATGGAAWEDVSLSAVCLGGEGEIWCKKNHNETYSTAKLGWTVGAGVEARVWDNWLARVEYRYADYGHIDHEFFAGANDAVFMNQKLTTQTVSGGLAYKFGGPMAPRY